MTTYDDGSPHTVSSASDGLYLENGGTAATVSSGAAVAGADAAETYDPVTGDFTGTAAEHGVFVGPGTSVEVDAGSVTGGSGVAGVEAPAMGGAPGIQALSASGVTVTGGSVTGGNSDLSGAPALTAYDSPVTISGGTFTGGDGMDVDFGHGGAGLLLVLPSGASGMITGGTFAGGTGAAGDGLSAGFAVAGGLNLEGGVFADGVALNLTGSGSVSFLFAFAFDDTTGALSGGGYGGSGDLIITNLSASPLVATDTGTGFTFTL